MDIQTNFTIQKQVIGVEFKSLNVVKHTDGTIAFILFNLIFDDNTNELKEIKLTGEEFNDFWSNFDNTSKIYEVFFNKINEPFTFNSNMDDVILNNVES